MSDSCDNNSSLEINTTSCVTESCVETCSNTPVPCPENHCHVTVEREFYTTVKSRNTWNIPAEESFATLEVPDVLSALPGSYLWNGAYGYLKIVSYNSTTRQIIVTNEGQEGNASPGTTVPACTEFIISAAPPGTLDTQIFPYLAANFTAPAVDTCVDILVTSVVGLVAGLPVQIGSGTYTLGEIKSPTVINICNGGDGFTPGEAVIAFNSAGEYQYPITMVGLNICANDAVTEGVLVSCNGGGAVSLGGSVVGAIPVLQNVSTNVVTFEGIGVVAVSDSQTGTGQLTNVVTEYSSSYAEITITNPSATRTMLCVITEILSLESVITDTAPGYTIIALLNAELQRRIDGGAPAVVDTGDWLYYLTGVGLANDSHRFMYSEVVSVAPGDSVTYGIRAHVTASTLPSDNTVDLSANLVITALGIPGA